MTLLPIGVNSASAKQFFKKKSTYDFSHFQSTLSAGYFAMLHVFKYLGTKDRLNASRVCKLWYQISRHATLWTHITLKVIIETQNIYTASKNSLATCLCIE